MSSGPEDNYGYEFDGQEEQNTSYGYWNDDIYTRIFRYSYRGSNYMKLINTPFWYNKKTKVWSKNEDKKSFEVEFEVVLDEIPEYILEELLFSMNEL